MTIERYTPAVAPEWDRVVEASRNGTFLHLRAYMDYHADRFRDCSLLARNDHGEVTAILPANAIGDTIYSHQGLTFGGWLMTPEADANAMMEIWERTSDFLKDSGFKRMYYKPVPHIYHKYPAEEDLYALFRAGGKLDTTLISSAIDMSCPLGFNRTAKRYAHSAEKAGVTVGESENWDEFWDVLRDLLAERYNASPVHTIEEIKLLHSRFPQNIKLYTACKDGRIAAGVVIYVSDTVAHCQYIATTKEGRDGKVLPLLFQHIIGTMTDKRYFDFGTSNEDGGRTLNEGLIHQKCGFGARAIVYNSYFIDL